MLEKYARVTNIEHYTLHNLKELEKAYNDYLRENKGRDISFPGVEFKVNNKKYS